jgi:hypothetical protein
MADDTPYDRIREIQRRGEDLVDQEQLRAAAAWRESFDRAKDACYRGECQSPDCRVGRGCPFRRHR